MIVVTGATGKLGHHVIHGLLEKVPASQVVAAVRNPEKSKDLAALGIHLKSADYTKPETLVSAFAGAEKILLISSNEVGQRAPQHRAVVDAAKQVGPSLLAYTSILHGEHSKLALAAEHKETEAYIRACGIPFVFLRNGWYFENHTEALGPALEHGAILGAAGEGRFASASRADYAGAAVAVLTTSNQAGKIYELAGDQPFTLTELAAAVSKRAGKPVVYKNLSPKDYESALLQFGLPAKMASIIADADAGAEKGELDDASHTLSSLLGRPTTSLASAVDEAVGKLSSKS